MYRISFAHQNEEIDKTEWFIAIILENDGHRISLHPDDFSEETAGGSFFPGWGSLYYARKMQFVTFHINNTVHTPSVQSGTSSPTFCLLPKKKANISSLLQSKISYSKKNM